MAQLSSGQYTLNLPNVSTNDSLVSRTSGDTLQNKFLISPGIQYIEYGGTKTIPTGTDSFCLLDASQALTNKTVLFPSGGSILNNYEELTVFITLTGIWASGQAATISLTRIGNMAMVSISGVYATANTADKITSTYQIPARFRPIGGGNIFYPIYVLDNDASVLGSIFIVAANGAFSISSTGVGGNFSGVGTSGVLNSCSICYSLGF